MVASDTDCDVPGTIITSASVMSTTSLLASAQTMEVGARMYHLVSLHGSFEREWVRMLLLAVGLLTEYVSLGQTRCRGRGYREDSIRGFPYSASLY